MRDRLAQEFELLKQTYPAIQYAEDGWFKIPNHPLPPGWNRDTTDVAFWAKTDYPGTAPYGIYVPTGILFNDTKPKDYTEPANTQPPFGGQWGIFSWTPESGWRATADVITGSNLVNWARGIGVRFGEGI